MATVWLASDVPTLARLAGMLEAVARGDVSVAVLAEVRQLEDRFGLSPVARRRLAWEISHAQPAGAGQNAVASVRRLRAVDPDAE